MKSRAKPKEASIRDVARQASMKVRLETRQRVSLMTPSVNGSPLTPFFAELIDGAFQAAKERGWMLTLVGYGNWQRAITQRTILVQRTLSLKPILNRFAFLF